MVAADRARGQILAAHNRQQAFTGLGLASVAVLAATAAVIEFLARRHG